jgi:3-oxoacyl-[acyl-carrier protein] reductase/2-hydroxycyclohexanecarboxyl-CoA dehydrogenase
MGDLGTRNAVPRAQGDVITREKEGIRPYLKLQGKAAVVTGAGRGIGKAIAERLAADGASVVIADINKKDCEEAAHELRAKGCTALAIPCDITQSSEVDRLMEASRNECGRLDILVNNAGIARDALLTKLTLLHWDEVMDVNLKGTFLCLQAAARHMVPAGYGRIVNVSSIAYDGNRGTGNYSASKGGIISLTRTACLELAQYNITVNAVAPGAIATRLTLELPTKIQEKFLGKIPCHRFGEPAEVANVIAFLASDDASYINGQVIHICGGLSVGYL